MLVDLDRQWNLRRQVSGNSTYHVPSIVPSTYYKISFISHVNPRWFLHFTDGHRMYQRCLEIVQGHTASK